MWCNHPVVEPDIVQFAIHAHRVIHRVAIPPVAYDHLGIRAEQGLSTDADFCRDERSIDIGLDRPLMIDNDRFIPAPGNGNKGRAIGNVQVVDHAISPAIGADVSRTAGQVGESGKGVAEIKTRTETRDWVNHADISLAALVIDHKAQ